MCMSIWPTAVSPKDKFGMENGSLNGRAPKYVRIGRSMDTSEVRIKQECTQDGDAEGVFKGEGDFKVRTSKDVRGWEM